MKLRKDPRIVAALASAAIAVISGCTSTNSAPTKNARDATANSAQGETPIRGGKLVVALEAESDGWDPTKNRWATSGLSVARSFYDALAALNPAGEAVPYLAKSIEPSDDYRTWTITLPSGIKFHDGTPLDSAAVKLLYDKHLASPLSGQALSPVDAVEATDELTVTFKMSDPWVAFPYLLTGQLGFVPAPATLNSPDGSANPIGTGPFIFSTWERDDHLLAKANPTYWREGLPYLAEIEFQPITDPTVRSAAFETGQVDVIMTTTTQDILDLRERADLGEIQLFEDAPTSESSELSIMLNVAAPPFDDLRVRQALAHGTNKHQYNEVIDAGAREIADGPFTKGSRWYSDPKFPQFDVEEATRLIDEYESETGNQVVFELSTTTGSSNLEAVQELQGQWAKIGVEANINQVSQAEFVTGALTGTFQANLWRQFDGADPDLEYLWWHSSTAADVGALGLNFARNKDPELDAALDAARGEPDYELRKQHYAKVVERLNADLPYIWINHNIWGFALQNSVRGMTPSAPQNSGAPPELLWGKFSISELWIEE